MKKICKAKFEEKSRLNDGSIFNVGNKILTKGYGTSCKLSWCLCKSMEGLVKGKKENNSVLMKFLHSPAGQY